MRKNYFFTLLFTLCLSAFSYGQVILAEGFDYSDGNLVPNGGWANFSGTGSFIQVVSGEAVMSHGSGSREDASRSFASVTGDIYYAFDFSVDDPGSGISGTDFEYFANFLEGTTNYRARMDIVAPSGSGDYTVGISSTSGSADVTWGTDLTFGQSYRVVVKFDQVTGTAQLWIDASASTDTSITGNPAGAFTADQFAFRQSNSSTDETIRVDNLMVGQTFDDVVTFQAQTDPALSLGGVTDNQVLAPNITQLDLTFTVQNFTLSGDNGSGMSDGSGDGYILGTATENSGTPESINIFSLSQPYEDLEPGDQVTLTAELVDNSGNSLTPPVSVTVSFSVAEYTQVADIAALRAGTEGEYYELTGEAIYTFEGTSRNQKYIQDGSAAVLIDDNDGTITTSYNIGDGITGIRGVLGSFGGVTQFVPQVDPGAASSTGNSIPMQTVTVAQMNANLDDYESEFVTIDNVDFVDADGSATFSTGSNYDITDGTNTMVFRVHFSGTDIDGTVIPYSSANITGIAGEFNGTAQVFGIDLANIVLGVQTNEIAGYAAYPNPVKGNRLTITTNSSDKKTVAIYNVLGRKVFSTSFTGNQDTVDVSNIASGIYILKVSEGAKISTQKLIIE